MVGSPEPPPRDDHAPLVPWGWSDRVAALDAAARDDLPDDGSPPVVGRVVRVTRTRALVATDDGDVWVRVVDPRRRRPDDPSTPRVEVVTGDWVLVALDELAEHDVMPEQTAALVEVLPRWSQLARVDAVGRFEQVLAADVDTVFVVLGLDRPVKAGRIERSLAVAFDGGAEPVVVLTKADLAEPDAIEAVVAEVRGVARGVDVVVTSTGTGRGLDELRRWVHDGRTVVLLGESGAGKSTLVNHLLGDAVQAVGAVRDADAKGRHTTTTRDLFTVPGGGVLLDTPGVRSLGLWDTNDGVARVFDDLEELADRCRFNDCSHHGEPGYAVRAAIGTGEVTDEHVARWLAYIDELDAGEQNREDVERERRRAGRQGARAIRSYYDVVPGGRDKGRRRR